MIARNVSISDLNAALQIVNEKYKGNIAFKRLNVVRPSLTRIRFTLRVNSSRAPGASRNPVTSRRSCAACWHVHGDFFDSLISVNPHAVIITELQGHKVISINGGNWQDCILGSNFAPFQASDACDCAENNLL